MTFTTFLALDNNGFILARCKTLAEARAVAGCVKVGMEFDEQPHRMYLDNARETRRLERLAGHAEKIMAKYAY